MKERKCEQKICNLSKPQMKRYVQSNAFQSIPMAYPNLLCTQNGYQSDLLTSLLYIGCFFGYITVSFLTDNLGRKISILATLSITVLGMAMICLQKSLWLIGLGMFLMGFGADSGINICFYFITETVQGKRRMRDSILVQLIFAIGGVLNIPFFLIAKDFHVTILIFYLLPCLICLALIFCFVEETPFYLIKLKQKNQSFSAIQRIFKRNKKRNLEDFQRLQLEQKIDYFYSKMHNEQLLGKTNKLITPLSLINGNRMKIIFSCVCILSLSIYLLYYGPLILISKLSTNLYISALIVTISEVITFPFTYFYIHKMKRITLGKLMYGISGFSAFILVFLIPNICEKNGNDCENKNSNILSYLELFFVFVFRFCSSLQFSVFLVYCNEVFPTQVRGMALGISSALGTIASTSAPFIFGSRVSNNQGLSNIMIIFVVISSLSFGVCWIMPETLNAKIQDNIEQLNKKQNQQTKQHELGGHIELVETKQGY